MALKIKSNQPIKRMQKDAPLIETLSVIFIHMKPYVKTGITLSAIHTFLAVLIYFAALGNRGVAQGEFVWFWLFFPDFPAVDIGYELLGDYLSELERNLKALIIVGIFGGVQWFLVGIIGYLIVSKTIAIIKKYSNENAT